MLRSFRIIKGRRFYSVPPAYWTHCNHNTCLFLSTWHDANESTITEHWTKVTSIAENYMCKKYYTFTLSPYHFISITLWFQSFHVMDYDCPRYTSHMREANMLAAKAKLHTSVVSPKKKLVPSLHTAQKKYPKKVVLQSSTSSFFIFFLTFSSFNFIMRILFSFLFF